MIVLQTQKLSKSWGEQEVLREINLAVREKERVGLVGLNGSGKTTLLRCITGEIQPDAGQVMISSVLSWGFLEQIPANQAGMTAWDAVMESFSGLIDKRQQMRALEHKMSGPAGELEKVMEQYARITEEYERANGYACENIARRILTGLGFSSAEFQQPFNTFSGGQKTRLNLGRLLALAPDILLLDEPTNNLDMNSVEWLEDFIKSYPGTVLVVSHDRMFLDRIATHIAEIRGGQLRTYTGNYSTYLHKRAAEDAAEQRAYQKQQLQIQKTEAYIRRFKAGIKSKQARGRQSQLNRLERLSGPIRERKLKALPTTMPQESGNDVLSVTGLGKSYQENMVLEDISFVIKKGDKIALIGPNGCGKTTLLKIISGQILADQGEIRLGSRVEMACFDQEHDDLEPTHTVLDEIISNFDLNLEEARTALGGMLFSEDEVFKLVGDLSGGEIGRLAFLKLILSGANFLLLDEPTNHLDIASCQVVEKMLADFEGTILVVSHDRYFIDQVAERVLVIEDGRTESYLGNYSYYHAKRQEKVKKLQARQREAQANAVSPSLQLREEEKERKRIQRRLNQELEALEASITEIEQRKAEVETLLSASSTYTDEEKARYLNIEYRQIEQSLEAAYEQWADLHEESELNG